MLLIKAQEFLGVRNSNYAGINSAFLNPALISGQKIKWDVNVVSAGLFFDNSFFFIPKKLVPVLGFRKIADGIKNENLFYTHFDPQNPGKLYNIALSNEIIGPSFYTEIAKDQRVGFTIASRGYANIINVPGHTAQNAFDDFKNKGLWNANWHDNTTKLNAVDWLEYGLHYSKVIKRTTKYEWSAGASLNYLQGIVAAYVKNMQLNYTVPDSSKLIVTHSLADYGTTNFDSQKQGIGYHDLTHGHGFSGSIGVTYTFFKNQPSENTEDNNYDFKFGASLIDIGGINFKRNSGSYHFETDSTVYDLTENGNSTRKNPAINAIGRQLDSAKVLSNDHFKMGLPTAISIQADWNFYKNFFVNATIIKGFGHGNRQGVTRADVYSITPRYETNWFEVSLPLSLLYNHYWQPRIGLAVRAGYFFFGADALGGILGLNDFERTDFYAGIHFFPLKKKHTKKYMDCPED